MSLYFFEGFDDDSAGRFDVPIDNGFTNGRWSGSRALITGNRDPGSVLYLPEPATHLIIGMAVQRGATQNYANNRFLFLHPENGGEGLYINNQGDSDFSNLAVHKHTSLSGAGEMLTEATNVLPDNLSWHYLELEATWGEQGNIVMRVDEAVIFNETADTRGDGAGWDRIELAHYASGSSSPTRTFYWDDFYVVTVDGTAPNQFLGDVRAVLLDPTAEGSQTNWTPSTGTDNFAMVANPDPATYVEAENAGDVDLYTYSSLSIPSSHPYVHGIMPSASALKTDTDPRNLRLVLDDGTNRVTTSDTSIEEGPTPVRQVWATAPSDDEPWDESRIANYEYGFESR